jgi:decaprenylphospho-beta-D-ribofuranose 2-oxidase
VNDPTLLSGWGNTAPSAATIVHPTDPDGLAAVLEGDLPRGAIARGLGRSYGDPAQNAGGTVVDATGLAGVLALDEQRGVVTAAAGTSLDQLLRELVPRGWFVPVTPGTRQVTVGGAIASDIHGKNHHKVGSWCDAVEAITLVTPAGGRQVVTPSDDPELFWATAGGMGLTGFILDATFRLQPIETSSLAVDTDRTPDLDTTLALMEAGDHEYDYSVAWIDVMATGASMGRSILGRGRFARRDELPAAGQHDPLAFAPGRALVIPDLLPASMVSPLTVRAFNELWYRKAPKRRRDEMQSIATFFHPLDLVDHWNRVYGPGGVVQWQIVVPLAAVDVLRSIVAELAAAACPSFLSVLKRMGPGNPGPLSFPMEGWTLTVDVAAGHPGLGPLLDRLDHRVVDVGGRIYLAKDARMRPELLPKMYPRLEEWREVRRRVDPDGRLASDLCRRLHLR